MGRRIRAKRQRRKRDLARAYSEGKHPAKPDKPSIRTSREAKKRIAFRWT